jgi:HK97 family phage major capsid protein
VNRFEKSQRSLADVRFTNWLRSPGSEARAMGVGTPTGGGDLVPPGWYGDLVHQLHEYDGLLKDFELWQSEHGFQTVRPVYSQFTPGAAATENAQFTDGPQPVLAQQSWGNTKPYAGAYPVSVQLVQDAPNLDELVQQGLAEAMWRAVAPVAQSALYSAISAGGALGANNTTGTSGATSGGYVSLVAATPVHINGTATTELLAKTISLNTAAAMVAALDEAYLPTAKWYMSRTQWAGILQQQDANSKVQIDPSAGELRLYTLPVVLASQATAATASTVSGPVLGDLGAAMTLRVAGDFGYLLRSTETRAEFLEVYFRSAVRADVQARDPRAVVGVSYAAS